MAVEETGMGVVEDKIIKTTTQQSIYNKYKNTKTCGVIDGDKAYGTSVLQSLSALFAQLFYN